MVMPPAELGGYSEAELLEFYNEAVPEAREWRKIIEDEIDRRHAGEDTAARVVAGTVRAYGTSPAAAATDEVRAEWERAAHAQYLDAEQECSGYLVRRPHHVYREKPAEPGKCAEPGCGHLARYPRHSGVDAFVLWTGSDDWARQHATDELRAYWDTHPRMTLTEYRRQSAGERKQWHEARARDAAAEVPAAATRAYGTSPADSARAARLAALRGRAAQIQAPARPPATPTPRRQETRMTTATTEPGTPAGVVAVRDNRAVARAEERAREIITESLRYAERVFTRHVAFPTPTALDTVLLWLLHANARDRDDTGTGPLIWRASPRLLVTSKERGSGKSTVLDLGAILAGSRAGRLSRVTAPGFAKLMSKYQEAAFLDEAKMIFGTGQKSLDLQGMLLTGYTARAHSMTAHAGGSLEKLFGPVALGGKDNLITTASDGIQDLLDRCIIIRMRRASRHYPDIDEVAEQAAELAYQGMATWATMMRGQLLEASARLNREAAESGALSAGDVESGILRATQLWRPLIACADVVGGDWPDRARAAASAGDAETAEWLADLHNLDTALWADPEPADEPYADLYDEEG